jgi:RHS repeat-associated protein
VYFYDGNGNVGQLMNLADQTATAWAKYEYDPYGGVRSAWENSAYAAAPFTFRFSTKYYDAETESDPGTVLYCFGYRYYSPRLGRWLSRDPAEEAAGWDLYTYVLNAPATGSDPFGLKKTDVITGSSPDGRFRWIKVPGTCTSLRSPNRTLAS